MYLCQLTSQHVELSVAALNRTQQLVRHLDGELDGESAAKHGIQQEMSCARVLENTVRAYRSIRRW